MLCEHPEGRKESLSRLAWMVRVYPNQVVAWRAFQPAEGFARLAELAKDEGELGKKVRAFLRELSRRFEERDGLLWRGAVFQMKEETRAWVAILSAMPMRYARILQTFTRALAEKAKKDPLFDVPIWREVQEELRKRGPSLSSQDLLVEATWLYEAAKKRWAKTKKALVDKGQKLAFAWEPVFSALPPEDRETLEHVFSLDESLQYATYAVAELLLTSDEG